MIEGLMIVFASAIAMINVFIAMYYYHYREEYSRATYHLGWTILLLIIIFGNILQG